MWQRFLDAAKGEDIIHDEPTFWGPNGSSSLDKAILPTEYMNRALYNTKSSMTACLNHQATPASPSNCAIVRQYPAALTYPRI